LTDGWTVTHNTIQAAGLLGLLRATGELSPLCPGLVISRASVIPQWRDQLHRMLPDLRVTCVTGDARARARALSGEFDVALVGPEMMTSKASRAVDLLREFPFETVITDDISALSNVNKTSRTVRLLTDRAKRVVVATATPLDKRLTQLYDTGRVLGWQSVLGSPEEFQHRYVRTEKVWYTPKLKPVVCRYCKTVMVANHQQRKWLAVDGSVTCPKQSGRPHFPLSRGIQPGVKFTEAERGANLDNLDEFREKIAYLVLRRTAAECDDVTMPGLQVTHVPVELGKGQLARYEELRHGVLMRQDDKGKPVSRQEADALFLRARQVTSGLANLDKGRTGESAKLDLLTDQLTGDLAGESVVAYCYFRPTLADLAQRLDKAGIVNVRIWGEQHASEQEHAIAAFNNGAAPVMLITDAGGMGLNLQRARRMIIVDPPLSAGRLSQIVGRVRRDGSEHQTCYVQVLLSDTPVDRALAATLGSELEMFNAVMNPENSPEEIPWPDAASLLKAVVG
jgi:SNF2 family DNA or RNA helicase